MSILDFEFIEKLGEGTYSEVYKVKRKKDGKFVVIKQINLENIKKEERIKCMNEVELLSQFDSKFIVKYSNYFFSSILFKNIKDAQKETKNAKKSENSDSDQNVLNIVMEYWESTLGDLIQKQKDAKKLFKEETIWKIFLQLLKGVKEIHEKRIIHRDLKPHNIFVNEEDGNFRIAIGDFGVSKQLRKTKSLTETIVGTPYWLSPQQAKQEKYSQKLDIWSIGVILFELSQLQLPFEGKTQFELITKIGKGKFEFKHNYHSHFLKYVITKCLQKNEKSRPSIKNLLKLHGIKSRMEIFENESAPESSEKNEHKTKKKKKKKKLRRIRSSYSTKLGEKEIIKEKKRINQHFGVKGKSKKPKEIRKKNRIKRMDYKKKRKLKSMAIGKKKKNNGIIKVIEEDDLLPIKKDENTLKPTHITYSQGIISSPFHTSIENQLFTIKKKKE